MLSLGLLGTNCKVTIEVTEDQKAMTYLGKGVNSNTKFFIIFYLGNDLHFISNAMRDVPMPDLAKPAEKNTKSAFNPPKGPSATGNPFSLKKT